MSVDLIPNTPFLQKIQKHIELHHEALHGSEPVNQVNANIKDFSRVKELVDEIQKATEIHPKLHLSKYTWSSYIKDRSFKEFIQNFDLARFSKIKDINESDRFLIIFKNLLSGRVFYTISSTVADKAFTKENLIFYVFINDPKLLSHIGKNLKYTEFTESFPIISDGGRFKNSLDIDPALKDFITENSFEPDPKKWATGYKQSSLLQSGTNDSYTPLQRFRAHANNNGPIKMVYTPRHDSNDSDDSDDDLSDDDYEVPMRSRPSFVYKPSDESVDPEPSQQPPSDSYWPSFW